MSMPENQAVMAPPDVESMLKEFGAAKTRRAPWDVVLDLIARYVLFWKQGFTDGSQENGFYRHGDVYEGTASLAQGQMVSSLGGALWKGSARTVKILKPVSMKDSPTVKKYYEEINRRFQFQVDHPRAAFETAYHEFLTENSAFGTAGLGVFPAKENDDHLIDFRPMGLRRMWVTEDANGRVMKIFYLSKLKAYQMVDEYGPEILSHEAIKAAYETKDFSKDFDVLWVIGPRKTFNPKIENNENMPIESVHILVSDKVVIRNSGFKSFPVPVVRFSKNEGWEYGFCPSSEALADIIELNAFCEMVAKAAEKKLFPPLWMLDDGSFGGGMIDTSPNAFNVLDVSSRIVNGAPIGVVGEVGEMVSALKRIEALTQQVIKHYHVDRLLDLSNQTRMTLGEAQIRNELRADSLGGIFSRQINEGLTPALQRSIQILVDAGEFGVVKNSEQERKLLALKRKPIYIPDEVIEADANGEEIYNIQYISPAARILRSEELRGIISSWQFALAFNAVSPELMIRLDKKRSQDLVNELSGATNEILLSDKEFEDEMNKFNEAQQANAQMQMQLAAANIAAKQGSAAQQNAQAQATQMGATGVMGAGQEMLA